MTQLPSFLKALRFAGLLAIVMLGLVSIIGTGGGSGGGGYSSDFDGTTYYRDGDGDGYGNPDDSIRSTSQPEGYVTDRTDCDDTDAAVNRGAAEICGDDKDNNCDGQVNESCACTDADGDGYYAQSGCGTIVDCDDDNAAINPGAGEICGDGIDNNCDGLIDDICANCTDADGDGYFVQSGCGRAVDCDDTRAAINPGAADICGDGIDNDCDGQIDESCPLFPDTGQTTCYGVAGTAILCPAEGQALYGQDACYTINPLFYVKLDDSGNELPDSATSWAMVRDNVTGLIWEVKTDDGGIHDRDNRFAWYNAADVFIARLNADHFGGYSDWRMPSKQELIGIINYGAYGPAIDTRYFPNTRVSYYLASAPYGGNAAGVLSVNFLTGYSYDLYTSLTYYVRAVRGEQSSPSFRDNRDATVTDDATGLMWSQVTSTTAMTWQAALAWCENASLAGYKDWRLPTIKELASIVDDSVENPAIDADYFPDTVLSYYWSSTTNDHYPDEAWLVNFSSGDNAYGSKSAAYYVRPVRGGQ